jgi:hypothetical protein
MDNALMMLVHALIIGVLLYLFMIYALGQKQAVAQDRSVLLGALILAYMIMFGHGLPTAINKNLF